MVPVTEPSDSIEPAEATDSPDRRGPSELRVSDADRDVVIRQLGEHASEGRLTLAEHEERIEEAMDAKTRGQLDRLLADLPEARGTQPERRRRVSRWILSVMGGTDRTGRWRVAEQVNAVTVMGGCQIDLRNAELDGDDVTINAITWMGGIEIYVPDSIDLEVTGFSLMGGRSERGSTRSPRPGAPRVRVRSFNLMGGTDIYRLPDETRELSGSRAARALRRKQRRGHGHTGM